MMEIQKVDRNARRNAVLIVLVGVVVGLAILMALQFNRARIDTWLFEHKAYLLEHTEVVALFFFVLMLPVLAFSVYLWRFAARTVTGRRFPPPGTRVVGDRVVLSGRAAVMRGRLLQFLAGFLALAALLLPAVIWYVFRGLVEGTRS